MALGRTVYLWNAGSGAVEELCSCANEADYICSVAWSGDGSYLALGTSDAKVSPSNTPLAYRKDFHCLIGQVFIDYHTHPGSDVSHGKDTCLTCMAGGS